MPTDPAADATTATNVPPPADLAELLDLATEAAHAAGRLLLDAVDTGPAQVDAKSSRTDLVSDLDRASEELIVGMIRARRPDDSILAEEGGAAAGASGVRWVIDPLDGTVNYVYRFPAWSVSVAAERDGTAVVGVVHDPSRGETFTAVRGRGAYCNGRRLSASAVAELAVALVGTGFGYASDARRRQAGLLPLVLPAVRDIRRAGSAALDLCWVAAGRLDAYYESGTAHWDRAAGALIATEAGAWVGGLDGGPPGDMTIAGPPELAARLRALLVEAGAGG